MAIRLIEPLIVGRIIGDVIDPFTPSVQMFVNFLTKQLFNGSELLPSAVSFKPRVEINGADSRTFFTLVRFYPSMPGRIQNISIK